MRTNCPPAARWRSTAHGFLAAVTEALSDAIRLIEIRREEIDGLPPADWASDDHRHRPAHLAAAAPKRSRPTGEDSLAFFDAIAPIVHRESIDFDIAWFQSRYDKKGPGGGDADYINCRSTRSSIAPSSRRCWRARKPNSRNGKRSTPYFEGCLPIEVMAARGETRCASDR